MLWTQGDFTGDAAVDVSDLAALAGNYGTWFPADAVPEPATICLLALGVCSVTKARALKSRTRQHRARSPRQP